MADVRSLLKSERASRRIVHPYARYSEAGKLSCSLCDIFVKSESGWKGHIRTPDHAKRAVKAAEATAKQTSKKRKADSDEEEDEDPRKRARGADEDEDAMSDDTQEKAPKRTVRFADGTKDPATPPIPAVPSAPPEQPTALDNDLEDDPEWLELQRMASAPTQSTPYAGATISAAPMTAEEVAAQAREDESTQKERRQAEIEDENEDAAQALEAEFDEMDELEERVRKLREKREALRQASGEDVAPPGIVEAGPAVEEMDEDDGDDDDEDNVWNFGAD